MGEIMMRSFHEIAAKALMFLNVGLELALVDIQKCLNLLLYNFVTITLINQSSTVKSTNFTFGTFGWVGGRINLCNWYIFFYCNIEMKLLSPNGEKSVFGFTILWIIPCPCMVRVQAVTSFHLVFFFLFLFLSLSMS